MEFRKGWENEQLAIYLLSRISYIARPSTVADDYGADLFCTVFEEKTIEKKSYGFPRCSFAIQVKSSLGPIDVTGQIDYLLGMDIPYVIGVVSQGMGGREASLDIYSAELLPYLFAHKDFSGPAEKVELHLVPRDDMAACRETYIDDGAGQKYYESERDGSYRLFCPKVSRLTVGQSHEERIAEASKLVEVCQRAQRLIAARLTEEYVYDLPGVDLDRPIILAGEGSFMTYRRNVERRIAEVFLNHIWIIREGLEFPKEEYEAFERLYVSLSKSKRKPSEFVSRIFDDLQAELEENPSFLKVAKKKSAGCIRK